MLFISNTCPHVVFPEDSIYSYIGIYSYLLFLVRSRCSYLVHDIDSVRLGIGLTRTIHAL